MRALAATRSAWRRSSRARPGCRSRRWRTLALIAISFGLLLALPTALTGLLDWLDIERGSPARTVATIHLFVMLATTVLFTITWLADPDRKPEDDAP